MSTNLVKILKEAFQKGLEKELLQLLFTFNELEQINDRCEIIKGLVREKETQRELSQRLNLSIAKITRGSNELKRISRKLTAFLENYYEENK